MAYYQIPTTKAFDFRAPIGWFEWICCFEWFRNTSGIGKKSEESRIGTLIYSMGDKEDDILQSFNLPDEALKSKGIVWYPCSKKGHYFWARAKFSSQKQEPGESVDDCITDLHGCLARYCSYVNLHEGDP